MSHLFDDLYSIHDLLYGIKVLKIDPNRKRVENRSSCDTMLYNTCSLSINYSEHIICDTNGKISVISKNINSKSDTEFYK